VVWKAIDLFAGPGGLSLGLKEAGFELIGAVEKDSDAGKTYRYNIGSHTELVDITQYPPEKLRDLLEANGKLEPGESPSLIAGGPPCPGFALIGRSKISDLIKKGEYGTSKDPRHRFIDDPRNKLYEEFVKYVEHFEPNYFVMENVEGMSSYQIEDDAIVDVIKSKFNDAGYEVEAKILNAADFGVPQNRKRIIFIGRHKQKSGPIEYPPESGDAPLTVLDAIRDLAEVEPSDDGKVRSRDSSGNSRGGRYRRHLRQWKVQRPDGSECDSRYTGRRTCHWTRTTNSRDAVLFRFLKSGARGAKRGSLVIPDSRPKQLYGDLYPSKWEMLKQEFEKVGLRAWKYRRHYVAEPTDGGKKWVMYEQEGFKDKMRRLRWNEPSHTVVAHLDKDGYMFLHPWLDRSITVREAARFQSFPDSFDFQGSMTSQFRQVGNAVPPLLAEAIGREVVRALETD
tara:strand:+ start:148 stop:1506 length:1359 start_codon:yes stop_codon:yes gene_type:complete